MGALWLSAQVVTVRYDKPALAALAAEALGLGPLMSSISALHSEGQPPPTSCEGDEQVLL